MDDTFTCSVRTPLKLSFSSLCLCLFEALLFEATLSDYSQTEPMPLFIHNRRRNGNNNVKAFYQFAAPFS